MSRLERTLFKSQTIPMKLHGSINIPEQSDHVPLCSACDLYSSPPTYLSPTLSVDSGRSTGTVCGPSTKYFVHGGPGFSLGVLDSISGSVSHLPVPVPIFPIMNTPDTDNFSLSQVLCMTIAGECQVWVGTESGSLHVFDMTAELRLSFHAYTKLPDPITMITTKQLLERERTYIAREERQRHRMEVLVGSPNGTLTIIIGDVNERGGLKNALKCPRKVIQLDSLEDTGDTSVNTAVLVVSCSIDTYWTGCGGKIVVLKRSDWKEIIRLDGCTELSSLPDEGQTKGCISQLVATDYGVWSTVSYSSTMLLWDTEHFAPKLKITCCNHCPIDDGDWLTNMIYITHVTSVDNLLLVGTNGGHLLVFRIQESHSPPRRHRSRYISGPSSLSLHQLPNSSSQELSYKLVAATYCGPRSIVSIHTTPLRGGENCCSPISSPHCYTPGSTLNVLVVLDCENGQDSSVCQGQVQMFEMVSSPQESPLTSPLDVSGRLSVSSLPARASSSLRRDSLSQLDGFMPKWRVTGATQHAVSCLPLQDSD